MYKQPYAYFGYVKGKDNIFKDIFSKISFFKKVLQLFGLPVSLWGFIKHLLVPQFRANCSKSRIIKFQGCKTKLTCGQHLVA